MKKILLMAALLFFAINAVEAQTTDKQAKKEAKAQAKAQRDAERDAQDAMIKTEEMQDFLAAKKAIVARDFVLEGSQIMFRSGQSFFVNAYTNFISLQGDQATVQIASMQGNGLNGFGGVTVNGTISNPRYNVANNGDVSFSFSVSGPQISATVDITLPHGHGRHPAQLQRTTHDHERQTAALRRLQSPAGSQQTVTLFESFATECRAPAGARFFIHCPSPRRWPGS